MERNPLVAKYVKAKIEEPDLMLPKLLEKPRVALTDNLCFIRIFASEVASGVETVRKVYRIRNKDIIEILGENCENMKRFQRLSNATIVLLADTETDNQNHSYVDFVGTADQVETAQNLILNYILKRYDSQIYPVILMPPAVHVEQVTMPLHKVERFIGPNGCNLVKLEMESRAWITIDNGAPGSSELDRVVNVYGPRDNVIKALSLIKSAIYKSGESSEAEKEIEELFKKLEFVETSELEKGKNQNQASSSSAHPDKYAKAKIEDPTQLLPKTLRKVNMDRTTGELYYWKFFEEDYHKTQHLEEAVAAGAKTDGKLYRIRNKELLKALGEDHKHFELIHKISKCTIGLLSDGESNILGQSFIHLMGTVDQVTTAEHLILNKILQTYNSPVFPVILMPATIGEHKRKLPLDKIALLMGPDGSDLVAIEIVSGAWIEVDEGPGCSELERIVCTYGPRAQVVKALALINKSIFEPGESIEAESELEALYSELTFDETMSSMKTRFREEFDQKKSKPAQEAMQRESKKKAASAKSKAETS